MKRRFLLLFGIALAVAAGGAGAQQPTAIKIGIIEDMSGPYSAFQGEGSLIAAQMAAEDFTKSTGRAVEVVSGDNQNKLEVGTTIARKWFDLEGVDMLLDGGNSAIALAVSGIARDKNKVYIASGVGTSQLTGKQCSPNTVHWTYDTWALAHGLVRALTAKGFNSWFFITVDYAFGKDLEQNATDEILAGGGKIVGAVTHPLGTADFSSFLLQAQASNAQVVVLANAGDDIANALKQASEFGIDKRQTIAALILNVTHMPALGLQAAQGVNVVSSFYWDMNEGTRGFSARFAERHSRHAMPNDMQAGIYSGTLHYLKAVQKLGSAADGRVVVETMKSMPTDDPIFGKGSIRADGRNLHPMYVLEAKKPDQSTGPWDVFNVTGTIPADQAFRPMSEGGCPLVTKS